MPRITVITVCYNSARTIEATLSSIAAQTFKDIEHIVVDGGSTDHTLEIVGQWRGHEICLVSEPDKGIYDAMNKGLALADGEVVGFLNSDDLYADCFVLEQVADVFTDGTIEASFADLIYVDKEDIDTVVRYWKSSSFCDGAFSSGWCPAHPTFYARKSVFSRLGNFDESYKLAADAELMMRFLECGHISSCYVPNVWVKMRVGGETNRSLRNIIKQNQEILDALKRHGLHFSATHFAWKKIMARVMQRWQRPNAS
ncbi:glycosyltransferase family 2 protein [Pseudomonadota bacterium]